MFFPESAQARAQAARRSAARPTGRSGPQGSDPATPSPGDLDAWFSNETGTAPVFTRPDVQALFSSLPPESGRAPAFNPGQAQVDADKTSSGLAGAINELIVPSAEASPAAPTLAAQPAPEAASPSPPVV